MAKVVTPIDCKIEAIANPENPATKRPILPTHPVSGPEPTPLAQSPAKIWKNLSEVEAAQLVVGDHIQLIPVGTDKSGKPKHNIVVPNATPTIPDAPPVAAEIAPVMSAKPNREIASYVQEMARLYSLLFWTGTHSVKG